jgi:hypothetical protein
MNGVDHLDPRLADAIKQSEIDGGLFLKNLSAGDRFDVHTQNSVYRVEVTDPQKNRVKIKGGNHLPEETDATISGSTWGGSMLKMGFVGMGMRLEVWHDGRVLRTSTIKDIAVTKRQ